MTDIAAAATEHGSVLLTVTTDIGQQGEVDLTIDVAEILKAQIETAFVSARMRCHFIRTRYSTLRNGSSHRPFVARGQCLSTGIRQRRH
jgi:hypothetical protein